MNDGLWHVLRTADSLFPTGSFSHSGGLEGLVEEGLEVEAAVRDVLRRSFVPADLPACALAHRAAGDADALEEIDRALDALKAPRELREGGRSLGRRRLKSVDALPEYRERVESGRSPGQLAVVAGADLALAGASLRTALLAFAYATSAGLVSAAMRLAPYGQARAQALLRELGVEAEGWADAAERTELAELGGFAPFLDIASMRHEASRSRIFIS